jgi:hypothetical protein
VQAAPVDPSGCAEQFGQVSAEPFSVAMICGRVEPIRIDLGGQYGEIREAAAGLITCAFEHGPQGAISN